MLCAQCIYCNICEHLSAWGVEGGLGNVSMYDWLLVHTDVAGLVGTIILPPLSRTCLLIVFLALTALVSLKIALLC